MRGMFWKLFFSFLLTIFLGGGLSVLALSMFGRLSPPLWQVGTFRTMDENLTAMILAAGEAAVQVYQYGGREEYRKYLAALQKGAGIRILLVREDNRDLTGEEVEREQLVLAESARRTGQPVLVRKPGSLMVSQTLFADRLDSPVVVGARSLKPPPPFPAGEGSEPLRPDAGGVPVSLSPAQPAAAGQDGSTAEDAAPAFLPPPVSPGGDEAAFFPEPRPPYFLMGEAIKTAIMLSIIAAACYYLARSLALPLQKLRRTARMIAEGDYSARVGNGLGRAGNEIADLGREFDIMAERTEKVIKAQTRLLRDISHELRSPLARLNVALELVRQQWRAEDVTPLARIGREADRLNELIDQLLTLTRLESGGGLPSTEPVQLADLLAEVAEDVNFEAATSNRAVAIVCTVPMVVIGSGEFLRRAFENIVRNSARFTAPATSVEISMMMRRDKAMVTVVDSGPGVPEVDLPHLFEPFYRVAEARERSSGGVGIGLAIAAQAIRAHGGEVTLENRSDSSGLRVTVTLPLAA